jgi:hypothetical protein
MGHVQITNFSLPTFILVVLTIWVAVSRFTAGLESNWPLVYYLLVVAHLKAFEAGLNPYWVYVGVVTGLLLRFEFMGGFVLKFVWAVELVALSYNCWRCVSLILMW